jgi:hypothetical protein
MPGLPGGKAEAAHATNGQRANVPETRRKLWKIIFKVGRYLSYPAGEDVARNNKRRTMTNEQLELGLNGKLITLSARRESRLTRAQWWFGQMRQLVNNAVDWNPAPEPRAEQPWLEISHRRQSA